MLPTAPQLSLYLEGSGKIEDTRRLMRCIYRYWYSKGYWGVMSAATVDFLNMLAIAIVAVIFTMRFRWDFALSCSETECGTQSLIGGFSWPYVFHKTAAGVLFGTIFLVSSMAACVYELGVLVEKYFVFREVEDLARSAGLDTGYLSPFHRWMHDRTWGSLIADGHESIGLRQGYRQTLATMGWGDFLEQMCTTINREQRLKFCDNGQVLDALTAVQTLLQHDNYLISFYDSGQLDTGALRYLNPEALTYVIDTLFDPFNTVHNNISRAREHIVVYAIVHLLLFPFFAVYVVVKVLVKNAAQAKSNYREFSQLQWNHKAQWTFRLYNEVAHLHECRMANGRDIATAMVRRLEVSSSLSRFMRRMSSTCVFVTAIVSFLNPSLLISGSIGGLSLLWWLTIALFLYGTFSELDPREREYSYSGDLEKLIGAVHYADNEWFESGEAFYTHITTHYLRSRFLSIVMDLTRSICAPVVLLYTLYDGSLEDLRVYMRNNSVALDGVGSVIADAAFEDLRSRAFGWTPDGDESEEQNSPRTALCAASVGGELTGHSQVRKDKKVQSIASFSSLYQQWTLKHIDQPNNGLGVFLHDLHRGVCEELEARRDGAVSQKRWQPDFSVSTHHGKPDHEDSLHASYAIVNTAHEREQLFVSQVGHSRSGMGGPRVAAYGTDSAHAAI